MSEHDEAAPAEAYNKALAEVAERHLAHAEELDEETRTIRAVQGAVQDLLSEALLKASEAMSEYGPEAIQALLDRIGEDRTISHLAAKTGDAIRRALP